VKADLDIERAKLLEIQDEYDRKSKLMESQAVSEALVARLLLRCNAQRASVDATIAKRGILDAKLNRAEAEHRAARKNLELLIEERRALALAQAAYGSAQASMALTEAIRDEAALQLERMEVRAPIGGIVLQRLVSPGSKLTREGADNSLHVVYLYDPMKLQVRVDVPLADAAHVRVGQSAQVIVEVLPDRIFKGEVTRIVHQADIQKNTVEVKVAISDPSSELKPEMLARVRFIATDQSKDVSARQRVFVPETLVMNDGASGSFMLLVSKIVDKRGSIERRSIVPGSRKIDGWIEIESGLRAGDLLVADPNEGMQPGDRVHIIGEQAQGVGG
ncbi:MAG: efflux RND transporter periplasmic adaptor subunit, partial [Planctomycetota bacterium]|nr:efflux RND transporter periplasmic adaptor subunit [Planctomycetota bacterium]